MVSVKDTCTSGLIVMSTCANVRAKRFHLCTIFFQGTYWAPQDRDKQVKHTTYKESSNIDKKTNRKKESYTG